MMSKEARSLMLSGMGEKGLELWKVGGGQAADVGCCLKDAGQLAAQTEMAHQ